MNYVLNIKFHVSRQKTVGYGDETAFAEVIETVPGQFFAGGGYSGQKFEWVGPFKTAAEALFAITTSMSRYAKAEGTFISAYCVFVCENSFLALVQATLQRVEPEILNIGEYYSEVVSALGDSVPFDAADHEDIAIGASTGVAPKEIAETIRRNRARRKVEADVKAVIKPKV